jgi:hypothetical protein
MNIEYKECKDCKHQNLVFNYGIGTCVNMGSENCAIYTKECDFCKNIKAGLPLIETDFYISIREIIGKNLLIFSNCGDNSGAGAFEINFCPMCGRKLE